MKTVREFLEEKIASLTMRLDRLMDVVASLGDRVTAIEDRRDDDGLNAPLEQPNLPFGDQKPLKKRGHRVFTDEIKLRTLEIADSMKAETLPAHKGQRNRLVEYVMSQLKAEFGTDAPDRTQTVYGWIYNPAHCGISRPKGAKKKA